MLRCIRTRDPVFDAVEAVRIDALEHGTRQLVSLEQPDQRVQHGCRIAIDLRCLVVEWGERRDLGATVLHSDDRKR